MGGRQATWYLWSTGKVDYRLDAFAGENEDVKW